MSEQAMDAPTPTGAPAAPTAPGAPAAGKDGFWRRVRDELSAMDHIAAKHGAADDAATASATPIVDATPTRNWIREYGRYLIVGAVVLGLGFPSIAAAVSPFLPALIVLSLILAVVQADMEQIAGYKSRALMVIGLLATLLVLAPVVIAVETLEVLVPYGLPPEIADGMILAALAPPMMASAGIAFLLGLDAIMALVCSLAAHIVCPLTITILANYLIGPDIDLDVADLAQRLALFIAVGFAVGILLRIAGVNRRMKRSSRGALAFDALSVGVVALLALGLMDGVSSLAILNPEFALWAFGCGLLLNPLLQFLGAALFMKAGATVSLTVGMLAGYRNTALLIVVLAGAVDPNILIFLAIVQVPTFIMPLLSEPVLRWVRRLNDEEADAKA